MGRQRLVARGVTRVWCPTAQSRAAAKRGKYQQKYKDKEVRFWGQELRHVGLGAAAAGECLLRPHRVRGQGRAKWSAAKGYEAPQIGQTGQTGAAAGSTRLRAAHSSGTKRCCCRRWQSNRASKG